MAYNLWIIFGLLGAFEFGKTQANGYAGGIMFPLALTGLFVLGGAIALFTIVARSIRDKDLYGGIALVASCIAGIVLGAWGSDKWGVSHLNGAGCFGIMFYCLASLPISGVGLLIAWIRPATSSLALALPFSSLGLRTSSKAWAGTLGITITISSAILVILLFSK